MQCTVSGTEKIQQGVIIIAPDQWEQAGDYSVLAIPTFFLKSISRASSPKQQPQKAIRKCRSSHPRTASATIGKDSNVEFELPYV